MGHTCSPGELWELYRTRQTAWWRRLHRCQLPSHLQWWSPLHTLGKFIVYNTGALFRWCRCWAEYMSSNSETFFFKSNRKVSSLMNATVGSLPLWGAPLWLAGVLYLEVKIISMLLYWCHVSPVYPTELSFHFLSFKYYPFYLPFFLWYSSS